MGCWSEQRKARRVRWLFSVLAAIAAVTVIGVTAVSPRSEPPPERAALRLASPLPSGDKYAEINRVAVANRLDRRGMCAAALPTQHPVLATASRD